MTPSLRTLARGLAAALLVAPCVAQALVDGEPHRLYAEHRVFGGAVVTGNTLMTASIANPAVNSGLLPRSSGDVNGLPFDATVVGAYLFWSGSLDGRVDRDATLTLADGASFAVAADRCVTVPSLGGFFYCRADVTDRVAPHPGPQAFNGRYTVGDVQAQPGFLDANGDCIDERECQAKYAGWSLVLVYSAPSAPTLRDIFVHDGFRQLDETPESPGIDQFRIEGFDFPRDGQAQLTFFALEGDHFLGVPPQDTDPVFPCATCFDFMEFNGRRLTNALNPPNNLFNSSSPGGFTLGLDLDTFDVSQFLQVGASSAPIRVGSGDGIVNPGGGDPAGAGESFFLGFVLLSVDRNAPNFQKDGTQLSVIPDEAAPRERVVIRLQLDNEGTLDALATRVRLSLPPGLTYLPGSLRVDGADPIPGDEAQNPLEPPGLPLGNIPFQGDTTREITFRAAIDPGVPAGTRLVLQGAITASNLPDEALTDEAVLVILGGLDLGEPTKRVVDTSGDGRFTPGEVIRYDIQIPNPNLRDVLGVDLVDELPPYLDLLQVITFSGEDSSDPSQNRVEIRDIVVPASPGGGTTVTIIARIHDVEQLLEDGVPAGGLNGFAIANQAVVSAAGADYPTDDPGTAAPDDPTRFSLSAAVDIGGAQTRKTGADVNGGRLEPGDRVRYTIQVQNTGTAPAEVFVNDPLPARTSDCQLESDHPDIVCAGGRLQGLIDVGPGEGERIVFSVQVAADAADGTMIQNVAMVRAVAQQIELRSEALRVFAAPDLSASTKQVDAPGGVAVPGQRLTWQIEVSNRGNRPATDVVVTDPLTFDFAEVVPLDGGAYDAAARTITWNVGALAPGATFLARFEGLLPAQLEDGTVVANQAGVVALETGMVPTDDPRTAAPDDATRVTVRSQPLLVLTKALDTRTASPGDTVTYTFRVRNQGTDAAPPSRLVDVVPDGFFAALEPSAGAVVNRRLDAPLPALDVGAEATVTLRATLRDVLPDGAVVSNQAAAVLDVGGDPASDDPDTPAIDDATRLTIESTPALALDKAVRDLNGGDVQPGDRLRYTLTVRATGDAPVFDARITDPVPAGLEDIAVEGKGALGGGVIEWPLPAAVVPGAPVTLAFEATVAADVESGTVIANQAMAAARDVVAVPSDDPGTPVAADPTAVTVISRPDLGRPAKTAEPREVRPGEQITFRLEVRNQGTAPSGPVTVVDPLPAGLLDWQAEPPAMLSDVEARWAVPPLAPGEGVTLTLRATVPSPLADGTTFTNQATAQIEGLEAVPTDDPALPGDADPTVVTVRSSPVLTLFKTVQDLDGPPTRPGDTLRYTVVVLNDGDDVARQVVLRDPIVDDLTVTDPGDAAQMGDDLVWQLGDLPPGAPVERTFEAQVARGLPNGTLVGNQALGLAANAPDEVPSDDPATADARDATRVRVVSAADLSEATKRVEPLDEGGFRPGNRVRYSIRVRNIGDDVARDVVLTDALPAALVDPIPSDGGVVADGVVTWRVDALRPSEVLTRTVEATLRVGLADGDVVRNQAQIIARDIAEPFLTDDPSTPAFDATAFVVVAEARLVLTKAREGAEPARPGGEIAWILTVTNEGDGASAPTEVTDPLPDGVEAPVVEAPAVLEGRTVRWPVPAVVPGGPPATLRIRARVPEGTPDGTRISNQARLGDQVSDDPATPLPGDPTVVVVEDRADLRGSVKGVAGNFEPGGAVLYTFEVVNRGSRAADAVQVIDPFPAAVTEIVLRGAEGVLDGRTLTVQLGALEPGERRRFEVAARVVEDVEDGQVVRNQAQVVAVGLEPALTDDPTTAEATDATAFVVQARAVLLLTKTVRDDDGGSFEPGDPVSYVLRIENTGNRPARGLEVIDPIDAALINLVIDGGELRDRTATWRVDALPAGDAVELQVRGRLRMDLADGREVTNQFGARIGAAGPFQLSDEVRFVVGAGGLVTTKTVRALGVAGFVPGGDVEYALTVMNEGVTDLDSVFVVDPVDLRAFARVEALDGGVFDPGRAVIEWAPAAVPALRTVPAGRSVRLRFRATLAPGLRAGETVSNQAQVSVRDQAPIPSDDPSTDAPLDPTTLVIGGGAGYTLIKRVASGDGGFAPGSEITYTLVAENIGSSDGEGVVLLDSLPPELAYVPGSTTLNGARVPDIGRQGPLELGLALRTPGGEAGVLPPGRPVEVQIRATISPAAVRGQAIANQGRLSDLTGVQVPSDDPATPVANDPTAFVVDGAADLGSFVKAYRVVGRGGAVEARIGDTVEWILQVTNRGIAPGEAVRVTDPLPAGVRYVDGSLQLDGRGLTDAADRDRGQVVNGQVTVDVGVVGPGAVSEVRFRTVVLRGPEVRNQGTLAAEGVRARLSDDDGVDANGLNPTVVPVGAEPLRRLTLAKRVSDPDGAPTLAGESLTWLLTVGNAGNTEATDVSLSDPLPTGLVYVGPGDVPRGVRVEYEPPPAGDFQNGRVRVTGLTVPAGEDVTVSFVARVDPRLEADRRICNGAQALAPETPVVDAPVACVDAEVRFSRLRGTTFEDRDEDGVFAAGPDLAFVGMRVAAYEATDPDGPAVLEATTDDAGRFLLDRLRPGRYRLRVFSSANVLLKTFDDVELAPDVNLQRDLLIDPSGRVYDSVEGDLIDGAEVFIYRDVDLDDFDPLDDESQAGKVLVPPEDLEAASQQGQRTAHGGLYQFAVRRPGRYFIEVVPPGPSYVAPSVLVPPTPGPAFTEDQARRVVPEDLPSVEPDADRTYFLAFDLRGPDDEFFNNHVPIDPLSSLIDLQKRAARSTATVGAIVTYEVDVVNRSPLDLVFDPATGTGGVIIEDVLPKGFKYIAGSAVRVRVGEGREVPLGADDPTGVRILRFGSVREEGGRRVLRPMDLAAGEAIRLRYQAVVGANVKPKRTYTNRATLLADGNVPISRPATADVLVIADPDFDQGLVLGKVFCDADGDGRQGESEAGTPGVRIFMDTGYYAVTDSAGQYHFKDIDPGTHAIKLDADTLLPGGEVTTDQLRIVSFTRGLPAKVDFGVTCPAETVEGATLELGRDGVKAALNALRDRYLTVWGDVDTLQMATRQTAVEAPLVAVKLLADGRDADGVDLPARAGGTSAELVFLTRTGPGAPSDRWALWVGPVGGGEVLVAAGDGAAPARLPWAQKDAAGDSVLSGGRIYTYRLEVAGPAGALVGSPAGVFGVGATGPDEPALVASMPADGFDDRGRPGRAQKKAVGEVASALKALEGTLRVEVHSDDALSDAKAKARDQKRAEMLKDYIVETVGLPAERVEAVGVGPLRPLAPNLSSFNRARNRRVELRHVAPAPADGEAKAATIDAEPGFVPVVRAGTDEAAPADDGSFALTTPVPEDGVVEVMMRAADGRRAVFPITVKKGGAPAYGKPREIVIEGKLPGELTVGGVKATPPALGVEATGPERVTLAEGKPAEPVEFALKAPKDTVAWRFAVVGQDGTPAFAVDQAGAPPATLKWDPGATPLRAGRYRYQLTVRTAAPALAQSAVGQLLLGELTAAGAGPDRPGKPKLRVDGQSVALDEGGSFYLPVTVRGDEAVLIEIERADGGRSVFFVQAPPAGDAPPRARPAVSAAPAPRPAVGGGGAIFGAADAPRGGYAKLPGAEDPRVPLPTPPADAGVRRPLDDATRAAMAEFGRDALMRVVAPALQGGGDADVPARRLSVQLPAAGAKLSGNTVPVRGTTAPGNKVFLNGDEVGVDAEGRFAGVATIDPTTGAVEVRTEDPQGNRGVLRRPVTLPDSQWFLLAMGEGLTGAIDSELDGVEPHTRVEAGDAVYFHGRAVGHLKGWMKGDDVLGGVWKRYEVTANVDTARRRTYETYFRQLIDPETFYPVYGDSAEEVKDAHSRGPVYVLIKADASTLTVGNFKSAFRGVELFNYDRTLYGGAVALDEKRGDFRHEVKAFAADQDASERHAYIELRGTGGSLYYLPHRELVEGSERLYLVERDRITGVERSRRSLARDLDYTVRYADGRVLMKSPVSSVTLDVFGEGPTPQPGGEVLDGHPVYLAVEYDHRDPRSDGDAAYGVHVRETWNDAVTLGGGYVREGRGDDGLPDYELWGAELRLKHERRTRMEAEVAQSKSVNGQNLFSEDGGLTFRPFNDRDGANDEGTSFLLRGGLELDDLIGEGDRDQWYTEGYWQYIGAGFYSGGTIQQQGLEKYGGLTRYWIDEHHSVRLQFDGMVAEEPSTQTNAAFRGFERAVTRAGHTWQDGPLKVDTEFVHTEADEGDPDGIFVTDAIGSALTWQIDQHWTLLLEQEVVARGDERLHDSTGDLLTTTVGGRYRLTQALQIEATESLRWSGDNATMIGLRSEIDERHTTYVQERFTDRDGQKSSTTVVGAEERFAGDKSGRAYGEYQLETGALGERNRAVLGVAKRTPITTGLILDVGYERSQVVGGYGGEFSIDAVSLGVEWLDSDRVKITGRYELRYEDNDEEFARRDRMQAVALTGLSFKLHPDLTLLTRLNYAHTLDLEFDATEAELIEGSLGLAWRPIHHDWVVVIAKYTKRFEQRPIDVAIQLPEREESDVVSLVPILELPLNLQLVEKFAYKRMAVRAPQLPTAVSHTVLWINRLNYHLTRTWDAGVEYRLLTTTLSQGTLQGTLLELNYIVQRHVRVGVGYNFTTFSDDEFSRLDEDHGGAFFRVIGQY